MIFSQSCPNYFPFLLSSLPLKLHFGHFPLFFSFYIQLSVPFHVFLLRALCLLDIFLFFLQYMSNFHFHFMSSFSEYPVFWIFPLFFSIYVQFSLPLHVFLLRAPCLLDISLFFLQYMSNFPPFSNHSASHYYQLLSNLDILLSEVLFMSSPSP